MNTLLLLGGLGTVGYLAYTYLTGSQDNQAVALSSGSLARLSGTQTGLLGTSMGELPASKKQTSSGSGVYIDVAAPVVNFPSGSNGSIPSAASVVSGSSSKKTVDYSGSVQLGGQSYSKKDTQSGQVDILSTLSKGAGEISGSSYFNAPTKKTPSVDYFGGGGSFWGGF